MRCDSEVRGRQLEPLMMGNQWTILSDSEWEICQKEELLAKVFMSLVLIVGLVALSLIPNVIAEMISRPDAILGLSLAVLLTLVVGGLFTGMGLGTVFGCAGARIDKSANRVISWWSVPFIYREVQADLSRFRVVTVKVGRDHDDIDATFSVALRGEGISDLRVVLDCNAHDASRLGQQLAAFLKYPFDCPVPSGS